MPNVNFDVNLSDRAGKTTQGGYSPFADVHEAVKLLHEYCESIDCKNCEIKENIYCCGDIGEDHCTNPFGWSGSTGKDLS